MTETQILMLNNLIYDPVFTSEGAEAFSVGELLSFIDTDQYKKTRRLIRTGDNKRRMGKYDTACKRG